MRENKGCAGPSALVFLDTETTAKDNPRRPRTTVNPLRLGVARYLRLEGGVPTRRQEMSFTDPGMFLHWLIGHLDTQRPLWLWAHNLAFDLTAVRFWTLLEEGRLSFSRELAPGPGGRRRWRDGLCCVDDPPTALQLWSRIGEMLWCVDSLNWLPRPLAELGEWVGLPKLSMPGASRSAAEWARYCARDCEILEKAVLKVVGFVKGNDLGNFRVTSSSQAMSAFRHRLNPWHPGPIQLVTDDDKEIRALERQAYVGPRCTVYFKGAVYPRGTDWIARPRGSDFPPDTDFQGPVYALDLTSAYPSVMRDNPFPVAFLSRKRDVPVADALGMSAAYGLIGEVTLDTETEPYPVTGDPPTRWCNGRFHTVLCGVELVRALRAGHVARIHRLLTYSLHRLFRPYVDRLWELRVNFRTAGDQVSEQCVKSMLTNLHGKFGQRAPRWQVRPDVKALNAWGHYPAPHPVTKRPAMWRAVGWQAFLRLEPAEGPYAFPAISAFVTAYHRERMRHLIGVAGPRCTYYEDADTLHVNAAGLERLRAAGEVADFELGKLRILAVADRAVYYGPKWYSLDDETTCVGRPKKARLTPDGRWEHEEFARLEQVIAGGPAEGPIISTVTKSPPVARTGRVVGPDGWTSPVKVR
jgi:hypothetical protein